MVVNHGVPEGLRGSMVAASEEFFNLTEEEKTKYTRKKVLDPIQCGSSFNAALEEVRYWRDFLKVIVHPEFNSPDKPPGFRERLQEYTSSTRELARELIKGIWESLDLETTSMDNALDLDSCFMIFAANLYPPCPQPELAFGLPPHSDFALLTVLLQNGIDGLQVKHNGRWVQVKPLPNCFLINTGDQMEIVSNGRYKSVLHRATLNNKNTRMTLVSAIGPSMETIVIPIPAPELVSREDHKARYRGMKFRDFVEYHQKNRLKEKSVLDLLRLPEK